MPSPTPDPQTLIQEAQVAAHQGDDTQAVTLYQQALAMMPDPHSDQALNARFALGKSQSGAGDTAGALGTYTALVSETGDEHRRLGCAHIAGPGGRNGSGIRHRPSATSKPR